MRYNIKTFPNQNNVISKGTTNTSALPTENPAIYTRPADWLAMPSITSSDQKIACLVAIFSEGSNFIAFTLAGNYTVDWGDGNTENVSSGVTAYHQYDYSTYDVSNTTLCSRGYKQAIIIITPTGGANLTSLNFNVKHNQTGLNQYATPILDINLSAPNCTSLTLGSNSPTNTQLRLMESFVCFNLTSLATFSNTFSYCANLKLVTLYNFGLSTANSLFYNCYNLIEVNIPDCSRFTTTAAMFRSCYSLQAVNIGNFSGLLTTTGGVNVGMFMGCTALRHAPYIYTPNVTNASYMFYGCYALLDIPAYDLTSVTDTSFMFYDCRSLKTIPLIKTPALTSIASMFYQCYSLQSIPLLDFANVVGSNTNVFYACYSLEYVPPLYLNKITNFTGFFQNCHKLKKVDITKTAAGVTFTSMFNACYDLMSVAAMNTSSGATFTSMFQDCRSLKDAPTLTLSNASNTSQMFYQCNALQNIPNYDLTKVTDLSQMFRSCAALTTAPTVTLLSATNISYLYDGCLSLMKIQSNLYTNNITNMDFAFQNCNELPSVSAMDVSKVTSFSSTFNGCPSLARSFLSGGKYSISYAGCKISKTELETMFTNLGTAFNSSQTITISTNWGAPTPATLSMTTTTGSLTATTGSSTASISTGMQVTGVGTPLTTGIAVTFQDTGDTFTLNNHLLSDNDEVSFSTITTTTGISVNTIYYVVNATTNTGQLALTPGGSPITLTNNGSGTMKYRATVVTVNSGSIVFDRPMVSSATNTLSFRLLKTGTALLKGYAVTG